MTVDMRKRSPERTQFLADLITTAVEHSGYGFPGIIDYVWDVDPADVTATIFDRYEEEEKYAAWDGQGDTYAPTKTWIITVDTMAHGLAVIRAKYADEAARAGSTIATLLRADRTNGDEGDVDVIGALAVLECALFGEIVYC